MNSLPVIVCKREREKGHGHSCLHKQEQNGFQRIKPLFVEVIMNEKVNASVFQVDTLEQPMGVILFPSLLLRTKEKSPEGNSELRLLFHSVRF